MGLKITNVLAKAATKKLPYIAPELKMRTIKSFWPEIKSQAGDVIEIMNPNLLCKTKTPLEPIIKACCLEKTQEYRLGKYYLDRVYNAKAENGEIPKIYNYVSGRFYESVNPKTLKEVTAPINDSIHLSAFDKLEGSLAASSGFDGSVISTDGLFQCAGLSVVDRSQSIQTLMHCYVNETVTDMKKMLEYILKHSKPENLEISVIPGCRATTSCTIDGINDLIKQIYPKVKINYMDFPAGTERTGNLAVILKNGELSFCDTKLIQHKNINPAERVIYIQQ